MSKSATAHIRFARPRWGEIGAVVAIGDAEGSAEVVDPMVGDLPGDEVAAVVMGGQVDQVGSPWGTGRPPIRSQARSR
jgi:hypothetical protein